PGGATGSTGVTLGLSEGHWGDLEGLLGALGGPLGGPGTHTSVPAVWELLYWRAPGRSALALAGTLGTLGCLARFSAVSVGAYGALAVLGVTLPLRLHQVALRALRRGPPTPEQPSRGPGDAVGLSPEQQQRWARRLGRHLAAATRTLTRLFLVHSIPESLKFAFLFYLLTYVGAVFNGVTLLGVGPNRPVRQPAEEPPESPPRQDPGQAPKCQSEAAVTPPLPGGVTLL
uniref:Reticulon n=1 Tax=Anas zonorhyncha TaxID=75864 RepID=A0A8B9VDU5_9AVES